MAYFNIFKIIYKRFKLLFFALNENNCCPKFLKSNFLLYCVITLIVFRVVATGFFFNFPINIFFADITKIDLNNLINQGRKEAGLGPLIENEKLNKAAELKGRDMLEKEYFSHQNPEGKSPWDWFLEAGYNYKYAGENLAVGFLDSEQVYSAWINSPSHKENILNPKYKEIGTAVLKGFGKNNAVLVVQVFGTFSTNENNRKKQTVIAYGSKKDVNKGPIKTDGKGGVYSVGANEEEPKIAPKSDKIDKPGPYYVFLNFLVYDYEIILKYITYGFLILIALTLFFWMLKGYSAEHRGVLLKSILFIVILSLVMSFDFNKNLISMFIFRQINI